MVDRDLTIEAKVIYGYFAACIGAGDTQFPSVEGICKDLNMGIEIDVFAMGYGTIPEAQETSAGKRLPDHPKGSSRKWEIRQERVWGSAVGFFSGQKLAENKIATASNPE